MIGVARPLRDQRSAGSLKAMRYWLVKSEPGEWSWQDHWTKRAADGEAARVERWSGVRNHQASNHLRSMKRGDLVLFYHSVTEKRVMGLLEVVGVAEPDPPGSTEVRKKDGEPKWVAVKMKAVKPLPEPVSLEAIKADAALQDLPLVTHSRLSVMPVTVAQWRRICELGGLPG